MFQFNSLIPGVGYNVLSFLELPYMILQKIRSYVTNSYIICIYVPVLPP